MTTKDHSRDVGIRSMGRPQPTGSTAPSLPFVPAAMRCITHARLGRSVRFGSELCKHLRNETFCVKFVSSKTSKS